VRYEFMNLSFISALNPTGAVNQSILRSLDNVHRRPIATLWRGPRPPLFAFDNRAPLLIIALGNRALLLISLITTKLSLITPIFAKNGGQKTANSGYNQPSGAIMEESPMRIDPVVASRMPL
jgi:hypothetical protein